MGFNPGAELGWVRVASSPDSLNYHRLPKDQGFGQ